MKATLDGRAAQSTLVFSYPRSRASSLPLPASWFCLTPRGLPVLACVLP
jgi:hypothetical protein